MPTYGNVRYKDTDGSVVVQQPNLTKSYCEAAFFQPDGKGPIILISAMQFLHAPEVISQLGKLADLTLGDETDPKPLITTAY